MKASDFLQFLHTIEKMKCTFRHSKTSCGTDESVAEHSYRLVLMAYLLSDVVEDVDMDKVLHMCIIHDLAEALTGDIPSFEKDKKDEMYELEQFMQLISTLPENKRQQMQKLYLEIYDNSSKEAAVFSALDKMEAVIQHNEADLSSWLDIEYELQKSYGLEESKIDPFLAKLRKLVLQESIDKINKK